ncbi:unnamed protein product [Paramecium pentaurelia]|uniref:Protein transport protein Sec61 subunit beta n=1 Tax=Paramecium pentaurelia TaxID=43138 RepID=A0A8S1UHI7_9CILI|nr:unnamed protein product [Paramecium pentaurelia]
MSEKAQLAKDAIKRRQGGGKSPSKTTENGGQSGLNFYSGDVSSLKVQPNTVLIISLVYLGIVVLLHIFSKLRSGGAEATPEGQ